MKSIITVCSHEMLPIVVTHLPGGVALMSKSDLPNANGCVIRFEGPGLPEWCETQGLAKYPNAYVRVDGDGVTRFCLMEIPPHHEDQSSWLKPSAN